MLDRRRKFDFVLLNIFKCTSQLIYKYESGESIFFFFAVSWTKA